MKDLSYLTGSQLREIRKMMNFKQQELANLCQLSWSTIQRAEKKEDKEIGKQIGEALAPFLINEREASLRLGLSESGIWQLQGAGLPNVETYRGTYFVTWCLDQWIKEKRSRFPSSIASQAEDLCQQIGMDEGESLLFCGCCLNLGKRKTNIAYRECGKCQIELCHSGLCAVDTISLQSKLKNRSGLLCRPCFDDMKAREKDFVCVDSSVSWHLECRYQDGLKTSGPMEIIDLKDEVIEWIYRFEKETESLRHFMGQSEIGIDQMEEKLLLIEQELEALNKLKRKVDRDGSKNNAILKSNSMMPEMNGIL